MPWPDLRTLSMSCHDLRTLSMTKVPYSGIMAEHRPPPLPPPPCQMSLISHYLIIPFYPDSTCTVFTSVLITWKVNYLQQNICHKSFLPWQDPQSIYLVSLPWQYTISIVLYHDGIVFTTSPFHLNGNYINTFLYTVLLLLNTSKHT